MFIVIQIDAVQTFITKRIASYLSGELKTRVTVDRVSIRFIKSIVLQGLYIEDQRGDTLFYAEEFVASLNNISTSSKQLDVSRIILRNGKFNLLQHKGEEHDNLYFITSYFSSGDTTVGGTPWKINISDLTLKDFSFRHDVFDDTAHVEGVNFSHLYIKNINGDFTDFTNENDSMRLNIRSLAFSDQSGFKVSEFSANAHLSPKEINLKKLHIRTPFTEIHTDLVFRFDSIAAFDEFTSLVSWETAFRNSHVSFTDIAYFASDLIGIDRSLSLEGDFKGSVNNFKGRNVVLGWGDNSLFKGNVTMRGLPVIDDTYMDINVQQIVTSKKDVEWLPAPPFKEKRNISVPENLSSLGQVSFKGKFTGFFEDFVAFGTFKTDLGSLSSDLNLKYNKNTHSSEYSGRLSAFQFDAGKIAMVQDLGKVTFSVDVKGKGLRLDNINANLKGTIHQIEFKKYDYKNIEVDGDIAKQLFNGSLRVDEPNVDFSFLGSIDFRNKLPVFNFNAEIKHARLDILNLFQTKENMNLQTSIRSHFSGNKLDNFVGELQIDSTNLISGKKLYRINSINFLAGKTGNYRTFDIQSDNMNARFEGEFELAKIGDAFKEIIPQYLPNVILPRKKFFSAQNFTYDVRIKNLNFFTETFFPSWDFAPNTVLKGHFNTLANTFSLSLNSEWIKFKSFAFEKFTIDASGHESELTLNSAADKILRGEKSFILLPALKATTRNNEVNFLLKLADNDTSANRARLNGSVHFVSASNFSVSIDSSLLIVEKEKWQMDSGNQITFDSSSIKIAALTFSKGNESFSLDGSISKNPEDKLKLFVSGFALTHLNSFLGSTKTNLAGVMSGNVYLNDFYNKFQIETDIKIADLSINNDTLGNATLVSRYNSEQQVIVANVTVTKGVAKIIDIKGNYFISKENNNLDFTVKLNNLYLHPLERYIDDIMTDVYGKVSADLTLTGTFEKPVFEGSVDLNKVSLVVNYLRTHYSFSTSVQVKKNAFVLDELRIVDVNNNIGIARGKVMHDYFNNFRFDIELQASKFQVLNTTLDDNILYYGKANASGYAKFFGPIDNMNMDISLSPNKGTVINIPLNTTEDLSSSNFITFINRSQNDTGEVIRSQVDLSGIRLNMNLDMNRDALINIIFDEKIGDVISGSGTGSLRLDINTSGNFNMYGTYTIEQGEYLFTLQNLINKKFNIDPGGRITWAGDPYEATVDISAVYVVYTSTLYNVLQDSTYKRRVPVDCRLFLTNKLMNPLIKYEIKVRGLSPTEESVVNSKLNSEENINMQMLGLLVFNQFLPVLGTGQSVARIDAGAGAGANASELLSNQVSNWLGQISKDVNIGLNYRAKDSYTNEEIKLLFSKSLLNDRLLIEGNVGYLSNEAYLNSNVVGDFYAEYKVSPDGRFRVKGFNRSNADDIINYSQAPYTQGFGVFYRQEFNTLKDLLIRWRLAHKNDPVKAD